MNWIEAIGYLGTALTIASSAMSTMIPLRIISLCASCAVITYGILIGSMPVVLTECIQIPFNAYRLWEMVRLVRQAEAAASGSLTLEWLAPFGTKRRFGTGETVFRKGDPADELYYIESGVFLVPEVGYEVRTGGIVGELGLLSPGNTRTASLVCMQAGRALRVSYSEVKQLYYQNPDFGFYFLKLTSERLFHTAGGGERIAAGDML